MIDLPYYTIIKDKCCLAYFGDCEEYLLQLAYFRDCIESQLDGLKIYIGYKDSSSLLASHQNTLSMSMLREKRHEFGYFLEILCDTENHPIEQILLQSGICGPKQDPDREPENNRCLIVPNGGYPTKSLTENQVQELMIKAVDCGLRPEFGDDPIGVGHVWGVESWQLWRHASCVSQQGSLLVSTGVGTDFYRRTFPGIRVINL